MLFLAIWSPPGEPRPERDILASPALRQYVDEWGSRHGDIGVLALSESREPLGAAWLRLLPPPGGYGFVSPDIPELSIALTHTARQQRVGSQLLSELLAAAYPQFSSVSLSVASQSPAVGFYRRAGFVPYERRANSIIMLRTLS
jgi:ribosomal protein S18 acetylase RimI-like enzyme